MHIFIDENIPAETVDVLRKLDNDVKDIRGTSREGINDEEIWKICQKENRLLITTDKGFSKYRNHLHSGILIIRLKKPNRSKIHTRIINTLNQINEENWKNVLIIVRDSVKSTWKSKH